jgi:hypothetical protein
MQAISMTMMSSFKNLPFFKVDDHRTNVELTDGDQLERQRQEQGRDTK